MTEDQVFDLVFAIGFVVAPLGLATGGLVLAIRSSTPILRVLGYGLTVGGTWLAVVTGAYLVKCPSQDGEICGDVDVVGDLGALIAIVLAIAYGLLVVVHRWSVRRDARSE